MQLTVVDLVDDDREDTARDLRVGRDAERIGLFLAVRNSRLFLNLDLVLDSLGHIDVFLTRLESLVERSLLAA